MTVIRLRKQDLQLSGFRSSISGCSLHRPSIGAASKGPETDPGLGLKLIYVLETHLHTDHQSGAEKLAETTEAQTAIGRGTGSTTASVLLEDRQELSFSAFSIKALATPGHTPGCMSFQLEGMLFCGDTLFIRSCGRTDFQQGDPRVLYQSIHEKIFRLPPETLVYPGHDYNGIMVSTIGKNFAGTPVSGMGFRNRISWKG